MLRWRVVLHHNVHQHVLGTVTGPQASFVPYVDHEADAFYEVELLARDRAGNEAVRSVRILPRRARVELRSAPAGATLGSDELDDVAPWTPMSAASYRPPGYADVVARTPGLVGQWRLDDPAGQTAARDDREAGHGVVAGTGSFRAAGLTGARTGLALDGGRLDLGRRLPAVPLTFEAWTRAGDRRDGHLLHVRGPRGGNGYGTEDEVHLSRRVVGGQEQLVLYAKLPGMSRATQATWRVPAGHHERAHHLAFVLAAGRADLYVDGVRRARGTTFDGVPRTDALVAPLRVGTGLDETVDELALYDVALPAETLAAHHAAGRG